MINPDNRRIAGVHSLAGAIIRQAVLDYKTDYKEKSGEYSAQWFLHVAGLMLNVDSLYEAIMSSDVETYRTARNAS